MHFNAIVAAAPPVIVRVIEPARHAGIPWAEWLTALFTLGLLIVGAVGLRSLWIAARALKVEIDPLIVVDALTDEERGHVGTYVRAFDIALNEHGIPQYRDVTDQTPSPGPSKEWAEFSKTRDLVPTTAIRVRNVGRSAAVGLRLLAMISVAGSSNVMPITITLVGKDDAQYIRVRNVTLGKLFIKFNSVGLHQPEDRKSLLYPRGYLAVRLRLVKIPGLKNSRFLRWMLEQREKPHQSLYVYHGSTVIVRAPGTEHEPETVPEGTIEL